MKKGCVEIQFDDEKLEAINFYLSKKNLVLENEMQNMLKELYEKIVPSEVRSYIEKRPVETVKKTRKKKDASTDEVTDGNTD